MTEFSDASETVPEQAPAGGGALPSPEEQLLAGIARAAAQHKVSVLSPVGAQRTGALVVLREFAEALVNGDAVAARRVLTAVEAEPKGDAPAIPPPPTSLSSIPCSSSIGARPATSDSSCEEGRAAAAAACSETVSGASENVVTPARLSSAAPV